MWYTITMLSLICCAYRTMPSISAAGYAVQACSEAWGISSVLPDSAPAYLFLAQADKAPAPEKQEPGPEKKHSTSGDMQKQEDAPQPQEKKPPPKDFVPTEKIDADKAVDFPADI